MRKILIILFSLFYLLVNADSSDYGLTFQSNEVNKDLRTGLNLSENKSMRLTSSFTLEFDLRLNSNILSYGYIFRIVANDTISLDLVTNVTTKTLNFVLNDKNRILSNIELGPDKVIVDDWLKISVKIAKENITFEMNGFSEEINYSFENTKSINIFFGKNGHSLFYTSDVPNITIKNLIIRNNKNNVVYDWKLLKHNKNEVYDEIRAKRAIVENGTWEIDKYIKWEKIASLPLVEKNAQIAFDPLQKRFFIATNDTVFEYSIDERLINRIPVSNGSFFKSGGSQLVYDSKNNKLISYSILYPDFITFDFEKRQWSSQKADEGLSPLQHHNRTLNTETNELILFGGYGIHKYHAEIATHKLDGDSWTIKDFSSQITPRYLSSMRYDGKSKVYILGGLGSSTGKQEELSKNLYDLYTIDINTDSCVKLAQFLTPNEHFVLGNSMVLEEDSTLIYSLAYNNDRFNSSIQLMSFNWKTLEVVDLANTIPYNFLDTESFCDLYLDEKTSTLIALVLQAKESDKSGVEIYLLKYPPLSKDNVLQSEISDNKGWISTLMVLSPIALLSLTIIMLLLYRRRREHKNDEPLFDEILYIDNPENDKKIKPISTIRLLGGFQVFDKNGDDITEKFTTIIKQLFLFIFLNTMKGKKITSEKIDEAFWLDMDKANAANNRNVNIRKLRLLLEEVGNIKVVTKNSYWYILLEEGATCDYHQVMPMLIALKGSSGYNKKSLIKILNIASSGVLLPNTNAEWTDDFKEEYSSLIIDEFSNALEQPDLQQDLKLLLEMTNLILLQDNIDENAVKKKCKILFELGQKGASKQCYDKFSAEYEKNLKTKPNFEYKDIFN